MPAIDLDDAHERAKTIVADATGNLSRIATEEDAKIQIINRFLMECLGWRPEDIGAEVRHDNGYSDYVLSDQEKARLLVEAKRVGELEIGAQEKAKIRHLKIAGPALTSAIPGIDQAASYAAPEGLPIALLTDGITWIVFKTFVPEANFKSKQAFVFPTLEAVLSSFSEFFDLLSKSQIRKKIYAAMFDELHNERLLLSQALIPAVPADDIRIERKSEIAFDLDRVFEVFFSKLTGDDDEDLLVECFVETRESRIADFALEKITASVLGNLAPAEKDISEELAGLVESAVQVVAGQTVFIVGPTGAGKSTFLDRFFQKTLSPRLQKRCLVNRINCLDFSGEEKNTLQWLRESLISSIEGQVYHDAPSYEELQGLYHLEYERRAQGVDAHLYKRDKGLFKEKFGTYLDQVVEKDREGYLKRMLTDVVRNRKKLPILVIDNMDEFSLANKQNIFQFSQSMARHAQHCLLVFPVTDKSAWSFSKTDIFGIYRSKSFFLPTPPPREVFRKRIEFLKERLPYDSTAERRKSYFTGRGINVSIRNLSGFAEILENVFVDHDYTSKTIGELTNYNIRRTLLLSKRVITSSVLSIEDLLKSFFIGEFVAPNFAKFMNALIKGDYNLYKAGDCYEIFPIFQVDAKIKQSPLIALRVLALLESARCGARTVEDRHLTVKSIEQYFEATGCSESSVDKVISSLFDARLIEPFDPSVRDLSHEQRLAISYSGRAHLRLASRNDVFFEQMALTTAIRDEEVAVSIRSEYESSSLYRDKMHRIRHLFLEYLIEEDRRNISIPGGLSQYDSQVSLVSDLKEIAGGARHSEADASSVLGEEFRHGIFKEGVVATVDWFDHERGYGFADVPDIDGKVFLHITKLKDANIGIVSDGDDLLCDLGRDSKGLSIFQVHDIQTDLDEVETVEVKVVKLLPDRKYGFVRINGGSREAFFHYSAMPEAQRSLLKIGSSLVAEVRPDKHGRGLQVRRVLTE